MTPFDPIVIEPSHFLHTSIRASAGSGKTFQLTNRYLQLIAAGAEPSSILASTFTRLAAGQIRDRILMRLAEAANDAKKRSELAGHLGVKSLSRETAIALLTKLARHLNQMQIRTLDSFFASVVHAFAIELDIPLGAEVVDENQARQMRAEAIRLMLDERKPQELVDLLRLLTQGSSERGVMSTIDHTVTGLYSLYREAGDLAWECVPQLPGKLTPPQLVEAIARLENAAPAGDKRFAKAHADDCERARAHQWDEFIGKGLVRPILDGSNVYYKKDIDAATIAAYRPVIAHARAELVGRVRDQTIATRDLLKLYHVQYEGVKRRQRAVTFDDLTAAMVKAQQIGKLDEIGYRLDAKLRHVLLDEFQDTSVPQWRALEPIAQELVSYYPGPLERTFFCVGDVKQSIYGWRDAAPEVFDELPNLLIGPDGRSAIHEQELARSFRSSQPVIDAVNQVFESLDHNAALTGFADAVDAWRGGFRKHDTAKGELPGYVELHVAARAEEGQDKNNIRYEAAANLAANIHRESPSLQIAILTRTNHAVARLLYELSPNRPAGKDLAGVSGRGGGPLTDAPAVNAVLDLLHMADHPDDTVAAFNVANSPLGEAAAGTTANDWWRDQVRRRSIAYFVRRKLLHDGYSKTIADWARHIEAQCDQRERRRLLQLVELAAAHDAHSTLRANDFIDLVENTPVADIQPAAVQVMTIHQAKGLEFDVVILPELEGKLDGAHSPPVVFERENETGGISRICRYMNESVRALVPELQPLFDRHKLRTVRESLSLLYVAMTRAIHGLFMIIDPPSENEKTIPKKASSVLRCALCEEPLEPGTVAYCHGEPKWLKKIAAMQKKSAAKKSATSLASPRGKTMPERAPQINLARRGTAPGGGGAAKSASKIAERESSQVSVRLAHLPNQEARDRGSAIHALFEHVEWLDEFNADHDALLSIALAKAPRRGEQWAAAQVQRFLQLIRSPAVQAALCRGKMDAGQVRVHRELPFARIAHGEVRETEGIGVSDGGAGGAGGSGGVQRGFIDRLVVKLDERCNACSATVIDFKTDEVQAAEATAHAEDYRPQMDVYRQAAAEMFGLDPAKIAVQVLFVVPGVAVNL